VKDTIVQNNDNENIVLTGFMATGKSTVGRLLAKDLDRDFVDTDHLIEERQKMTIPEIFSRKGESAFRHMETEVARELGQRQGLVISTGGRMLLDPANVSALSSKGRVFCLVATPQEILLRLIKDKDNHRPLLDVPNPGEQIIALLQKREKGYQQFFKIATDNKQPSDIKDIIIKILYNKMNDSLMKR